MGRLFIAEKPELARAIVEGLGGGSRQGNYYVCGQDKVTWCIGHMLELFEPEDYDSKYKQWSLDDLPIYHSDIQYKIKEETKDQFKTIQKLIGDAEIIVHAGDPDAEGQLIVDEILEYCKNKKPVKRFMTNDNNLKIVQKSLANLTDNKKYFPLYQSALARNIGDQLYGFNMTRAYSVAAQKKGYDGTLNVGRVMTPILGLVVNRDRANANHEKQFYYDVNGVFSVSNLDFPAKYKPSEVAPIDDKKRLTDKSFAENIVNDCRGQSATIINVDSSVKESSPPLPFNMIKLQIAAAKRFDYEPKQVMKITQELREKYKLITYNGSDCQYLNEEQHEDAPAVLAAIAKTASDYTVIANNADPNIKSRAFNNKRVSAHHAIIPTEATTNLAELKEPLRNIYLLIAQAYIAQFYPKYKYQHTQLTLECSDHQFGVSSKVKVSDGWKILYQSTANDDEEDDSIKIDLSKLSNNDSGRCIDIDVFDKETKPLPLYTMDTLLADLTQIVKYVKDPEVKKLYLDKDKDINDKGGIGTSRTRDGIVEKEFKLGFFVKKGKKIISTELGQQFFDALPEIATSPDMTALWHKQQTMIESGEITATEFLNDLVTFISKQVESVKKNGLDIKIETHSCHKCKTGTLKRIKGKNGFFWACREKECDATISDKSGKPDFKSLETHPCPSCDKDMKRRKGKNGFFWGCTGFPECKTTLKDKRGKPVVEEKKPVEESEFKCKECDKPLIRRVSVKGKGKDKKENVWFGCSGFPSCKTRYFSTYDGTKPKYE